MAKLGYILAASHSGSTLLAMLLGAHPEACTVGELKAGGNLGNTDQYRCSCGAKIKECSFWNQVSTAMGGRGLTFDPTRTGTNIQNTDIPYLRRFLQPLHRGPVFEGLRDAALALSPRWHGHYRSAQRQNAALVGSILEITGKRMVIDSSKTGVRLKYLLRNPDLDVRVIRMIRDGRAVSLTYMEPFEFADATDPSLRGGGSGNGKHYKKFSASEAATIWRRSNEEAEHVLAGVDRSKWMEVRYEDLCADPDTTLRKICKFLELAPEKIVRNFRTVEQHVVGNGMRMDKTSEIRADDRWRSHLAKDDLDVFNSIAGELNRKYGYS